MKILTCLFFLIPICMYTYPQPNTLYNEGLVFYQQGDRGRAAQALKKALLLKPSHKEARSLYNSIQEEIGSIPLSENTLVLLFLGIADFFPPQGDAFISSLLFLAGALLIVSFLLRKTSRKSIILSSFLLFLSAGYALQAYIKYQLIFKKDVRVALTNLSVMDEASGDAKALGDFPAGSEFTVLGNQGDYLLVQGQTRLEGWVLKDHLPPLWEK